MLAAWHYLRWGIAIVFAVLAVELLYHFGPDVRQRFRDSLAGAMVAVMTWIGLSDLLRSYFRHFENFAILVGGGINFLLGELRDHSTPQSSGSARTQINRLNAAE